MLENKRNIEEYMRNVKTVEGTIIDLNVSDEVIDSINSLLESTDCPDTEIFIERPPEICNVCGSTYLIKEGKCTTCYECGYSLCNL